MTTPEMKDVEVSDAIEELQGWISELDYEELARLYSQHVADADVAIRVTEPGQDDSSNWFMAGTCMQVVLKPVEEVST